MWPNWQLHYGYFQKICPKTTSLMLTLHRSTMFGLIWKFVNQNSLMGYWFKIIALIQSIQNMVLQKLILNGSCWNENKISVCLFKSTYSVEKMRLVISLLEVQNHTVRYHSKISLKEYLSEFLIFWSSFIINSSKLKKVPILFVLLR